LIASIYQTKQGKIITNGEVVYMNGFGLGLKPRLTMKDNIYLIASLMGLSRQEIKKRFTEIVEFSELEDYVNTKVYQFSYGMISRLCFSTTIHCLEQKNPDIILLDEVFGTGGDLAFQNKAIAKMEEFIKGGAAVILVSHDLNIIQQYCDRVIWLKNGQIIQDGKPQDVVKEYIADTQANLT
jgi:ABC-type polysaccharide/polyol phosphate transport system ATPase subunit